MSHPPVILPPQPGVGEQFAQAFAPLLQALQLRAQRQMQQQQLTEQYGQLALQRDRLDFEKDQQKQRTAQLKQAQDGIAQMGQQLQQQIQQLQNPSPYEAQVQGLLQTAMATGDTKPLVDFSKSLEGAQRAQKVQGVYQSYMGKQPAPDADAQTQAQFNYQFTRDLAAADPTNDNYATAAANAARELEQAKRSGHTFVVPGVDSKGNPDQFVVTAYGDGKYSKQALGVGPRNAATLNRSQQQAQEKLVAGAAMGLHGIQSAVDAIRKDDKADVLPLTAQVAGALAGRIGRNETGDALAQSVESSMMRPTQTDYRTAIQLTAHSIAGLYSGTRSRYIYQSILNSYSPNAGQQSKESRDVFRRRLVQLQGILQAIQKGDMAALAGVRGLDPADVQFLLGQGPEPAGPDDQPQQHIDGNPLGGAVQTPQPGGVMEIP